MDCTVSYGGMNVRDELGKMWKTEVSDCFKVHLLSGTEENLKKTLSQTVELLDGI
jgi:hypothetical protein